MNLGERPANSGPDSQLWTADDLAACLGVSRRQVMDWQRQFDWPSVRIGRTIRWTPEQVDEIIRRHTQGGGTNWERPWEKTGQTERSWKYHQRARNRPQ